MARGALRGPAAALLGALGSRLAGPAWLVGGSVRDALLGRGGNDLDVAVPSGALALGRALAAAVPGASFVLLDGERGVGRVVAAAGPGAGGSRPVQVDIADFAGPDLEADLRRRDFTVDALAVAVAELEAAGEAPVIDPTGGLADLKAGVLRPVGPGAMVQDPVRILRGVRLALLLGFALDPEAEAQMIAAGPALGGIAAERVRDELMGILGARRAAAGLRTLDRLGSLDSLLPEHRAMRGTAQPEPHRFDVWEHSLRAVAAADVIVADCAALAPWGPVLEDHLAEDLGGEVSRRHVLKLAAWLHDVAKPETRAVVAGRVRFIGHDVRGAERAAQVAARLRLPARASRVLERLVAQHLRPMHLAQAGVLTRRARHRFFRDLGEDARDLLLLALADAAAVRGEEPQDVWRGPGGELLRTLMAGVGEEERAAAAPPLVRGEDVMAAFGLAPGPEVGRLLAIAREAQALGLARTRAEVLDHLRRARAGLLDTPGAGP